MTILLASILLIGSCFKDEGRALAVDEIKWQLYKFNLLAGDRICQIIPADDSLLLNSRLYEYNLVLDTAVENSDPEVHYRFFERGVAPCHSYYYSVKLLSQEKDSIILNYGERGEIITSIQWGEEEFVRYLKKIPVELMSSNLATLAQKKGLLSTD